MATRAEREEERRRLRREAQLKAVGSVDTVISRARLSGATHVQIDQFLNQEQLRTANERPQSVHVPIDQAKQFIARSASPHLRVTAPSVNSSGAPVFLISDLTPGRPSRRGTAAKPNPAQELGGRILSRVHDDAPVVGASRKEGQILYRDQRRKGQNVTTKGSDAAAAQRISEDQDAESADDFARGINFNATNVPPLKPRSKDIIRGISDVYDVASMPTRPGVKIGDKIKAKMMTDRLLRLSMKHDPDFERDYKPAAAKFVAAEDNLPDPVKQSAGRKGGSKPKSSYDPTGRSILFSRENAVPFDPEDSRLWASRSMARAVASGGGAHMLRNLADAERFANADISLDDLTRPQPTEYKHPVTGEPMHMVPLPGIENIDRDPNAEVEGRIRWLMRHNAVYSGLLDGEGTVAQSVASVAKSAGVSGVRADFKPQTVVTKADAHIAAKDAAATRDPYDPKNMIGIDQTEIGGGATFSNDSRAVIPRGHINMIRGTVRAELAHHLATKILAESERSNAHSEAALQAAQEAVTARNTRGMLGGGREGTGDSNTDAVLAAAKTFGEGLSPEVSEMMDAGRGRSRLPSITPSGEVFKGAYYKDIEKQVRRGE